MYYASKMWPGVFRGIPKRSALKWEQSFKLDIPDTYPYKPSEAFQLQFYVTAITDVQLCDFGLTLKALDYIEMF